MWKCPTCGEEVDDQFDSCWRCTKVEPVQESAEGLRRERGRAGFWCAWRRGWLVLAMMLAFGIVATIWTKLFECIQGFFVVAVLAAAIFILPPCAYWIFVLFFGQEAWPLRRALREIPPEEQAVALLDEATKLETRGRVKEALAIYQTVVERFGGTAASHDAQKSIESLRAKIGEHPAA